MARRIYADDNAKECPFCGGPAGVVSRHSGDAGPMGTIVYAVTMGCVARCRKVKSDWKADSTTAYQDGLEFWNSRADNAT